MKLGIRGPGVILGVTERQSATLGLFSGLIVLLQCRLNLDEFLKSTLSETETRV